MSVVLDEVNNASVFWWNYIVLTSWQGAIVGAVLLVVVGLLGRRWPAPLRYALLVLALLKFACPPLLPVPTGLFTHISPTTISLPIVREGKPAQASDPQKKETVMAVSGQWFAKLSQPVGSTLRAVHWTCWLMMLHLTGTAAIGFTVFQRARRLKALARKSRLVRGGMLPTQYRDLVIALGLSRVPVLAVSDGVPGPLSFGVQTPSILLPERILNRLSPGELKAVLAHELAHCQRGDLWLNWIQLALAAVWWFHPVVWLVNRGIRDVREDCCDDLLLARGLISNDAYCNVLIRAASETTPSLALSSALGLGETLHPLARRLVRITDWTLQRSDRVSWAGSYLVLAAAAVFFPGIRGMETGSAAVVLQPVSATTAVSQLVSSPARGPLLLPAKATVQLSTSRAAAPGTPGNSRTANSNRTPGPQLPARAVNPAERLEVRPRLTVPTPELPAGAPSVAAAIPNDQVFLSWPSGPVVPSFTRPNAGVAASFWGTYLWARRTYPAPTLWVTAGRIHPAVRLTRWTPASGDQQGRRFSRTAIQTSIAPK